MKQITPLSKFPTEALLEMYRRNRTCYDQSYSRTECRWKNGKPTYWEPTVGDFVDDYCLLGIKPGVTYRIPLYYSIVPERIWNYVTKIEGNKGVNKIAFTWQGMYWEGSIDELKKEFENRPHINMMGRKAYRKWLISYRKNLKK